MKKNFPILALVLFVLAIAGCNKNETIEVSKQDISFPREAGWRKLTLNANCNWTVVIDDGADWFSVSPMSGGPTKSDTTGNITVTVQDYDSDAYRTGSFTIQSAKGHVKASVRVSQNVLSISEDELWFADQPETQTIEINARCNWTVTIDDGADWYTVSPMSGSTVDHGTLTIAVQAYEEPEFRSSSFTIRPDNGTDYARVYLSQNVIAFGDIMNTIFGVSMVEHWNTDFYGHHIEDSYLRYDGNPYDTMTGFTMYFLENGEGLQRDVKGDSVIIWPFTYIFDSLSRNLHIEFETPTDTAEMYDLRVLTATDRLFRFFHEWNDHSWERANMKKIGVVTPQEKSLIKRYAKKRSGRGPIFRF